MAPASLLGPGAAMLVFVAANAGLRSYAASSHLPALLGALALFSLGNVMLVRPMGESGLALAIPASSAAQLVLISAVAFAWFGERPTALQLAGMALGVGAVVLIARPQGARA